MISSAIFYVGFLLIGIVPYYFYDEMFWDRNLFITIIGAVTAVVLLITLLANINTSFMILKPYKSLTYLITSITVILSFIIVDLIFSEASSIGEDTMAIIFVIGGGVTIILNTINLYIFKRSNEEHLTIKWDQGISKISENEEKYNNVIKIQTILTFIFMFTIIYNFTMDGYIDFILLIVLAWFSFKYYIKEYQVANKDIVSILLVFMVLSLISIYLLVTYRLFFNQHVVIRGFVILFPYIQLFIVVVPDAYKQYWLLIDKSLKE